MDAYLIDTSILSACLNPSHPSHSTRRQALDSLSSESVFYVSAVALAELTFGAELALTLGKGNVPTLREMVRTAQSYNILDLTHHTASAYAELKAKLAQKYLANPLRRARPKYIEDWVDQATGKALGFDENDLWMCAQAKERSLLYLTADGPVTRIPPADPDVRLVVV